MGFFLVVFSSLYVRFYRRASRESERVNQILRRPAGALVGGKNRFELIVFFPPIRGHSMLYRPPGRCQGPSGEEKNFEIGH